LRFDTDVLRFPFKSVDNTTGEMILKEQIRGRLAALRLRTLAEGYTREAAVLMPIFEKDGEAHFLLTRRTHEVQTHKGQISFPGGMREVDEDLEKTALRETFEEIGIAPAEIEVLGRFHDFLSSTEYRVSPFAGYLNAPFTTTPQAHEVAEILAVPFSIFRDRNRLRVEQMHLAGEMREVYFYSYRDHEIWGLTARIIREFLAELRPGS
jgi:8-oxo-dGTP pyrophosphatase MutT (NUDIX family)